VGSIPVPKLRFWKRRPPLVAWVDFLTDYLINWCRSSALLRLGRRDCGFESRSLDQVRRISSDSLKWQSTYWQALRLLPSLLDGACIGCRKGALLLNRVAVAATAGSNPARDADQRRGG
jgi:hypothetical protein